MFISYNRHTDSSLGFVYNKPHPQFCENRTTHSFTFFLPPLARTPSSLPPSFSNIILPQRSSIIRLPVHSKATPRPRRLWRKNHTSTTANDRTLYNNLQPRPNLHPLATRHNLSERRMSIPRRRRRLFIFPRAELGLPHPRKVLQPSQCR